MNPSDIQLFRAGSTFFVPLPDGTFFSVTATGASSITDNLPVGVVTLKKYPETGVENTPPSSTVSLMKVALMVAEHFNSKHPPTSTEEKSAP